MRSTLLLLVVGALAAATSGLEAQQRERQHTPAERTAMERRLRERVATHVQRELNLTDAQTAKLVATNERIDGQRRPLLQRERTLRSQLRSQLKKGRDADDGTVGTLLDGLLLVHRQRLELVEAEQRELAQYLTPVQRARYFSLQENWRRQVEQQAEQDRGRARRPGGGDGDGDRRPDSDR